MPEENEKNTKEEAIHLCHAPKLEQILFHRRRGLKPQWKPPGEVSPRLNNPPSLGLKPKVEMSAKFPGRPAGKPGKPTETAAKDGTDSCCEP